jgi:hypothetical protein
VWDVFRADVDGPSLKLLPFVLAEIYSIPHVKKTIDILLLVNRKYTPDQLASLEDGTFATKLQKLKGGVRKASIDWLYDYVPDILFPYSNDGTLWTIKACAGSAPLQKVTGAQVVEIDYRYKYANKLADHILEMAEATSTGALAINAANVFSDNDCNSMWDDSMLDDNVIEAENEVNQEYCRAHNIKLSDAVTQQGSGHYANPNKQHPFVASVESLGNSGTHYGPGYVHCLRREVQKLVTKWETRDAYWVERWYSLRSQRAAQANEPDSPGPKEARDDQHPHSESVGSFSQVILESPEMSQQQHEGSSNSQSDRVQDSDNISQQHAQAEEGEEEEQEEEEDEEDEEEIEITTEKRHKKRKVSNFVDSEAEE